VFFSTKVLLRIAFADKVSPAVSGRKLVAGARDFLYVGEACREDIH
jgi:hypothetical protein